MTGRGQPTRPGAFFQTLVAEADAGRNSASPTPEDDVNREQLLRLIQATKTGWQPRTTRWPP